MLPILHFIPKTGFWEQPLYVQWLGVSSLAIIVAVLAVIAGMALHLALKNEERDE